METQDAAAVMSELPRRLRISHMQEVGLLIVVSILVLLLSIYGFYDARNIGRTNTFLNANNLVGQVAAYGRLRHHRR
jgi:hypothetical protein